MHKTVDTNFRFKKDPNGFINSRGKTDLGYSGYVINQVVHPHGVLSTPRSLLFGVDAEDDYKEKREETQRLKKPYWSQAHAMYRNHFDQADLFIIFGCSIGESDGWWWRNIARALKGEKSQTYSKKDLKYPGKVVKEFSELIIYRRQENTDETIESIKEKFLKSAGVSPKDKDLNTILDRIHVIAYNDDTERIFLSTSN